MRRFESAVGRLDVPGRLSAGRDALRHWRAGTHLLSKAASALILAAVIWAFITTHTQDEWFIYAENVHFENTAYLEAAPLYNRLQVEGWSIFWLHPETLRQELLTHPAIVDAQVRLQLPGQIEVAVTERQAVALWITHRGAYRLADNGAVLSAPLSADDVAASPVDQALPQIVDPMQEAQQPGITDAAAMDPAILAGARHLIETLPELENRVRYNRSVGFNFPLPDGDGWVYWGDGLHLEEKIMNLAAARQYIVENNVENRIVDVRFLNRPYLR